MLVSPIYRTVENVAENDADVVLTATRKTLANLYVEEASALKGTIQDVVREAGLSDSGPETVEIVGGDRRIPWEQETIQGIVEHVYIQKIGRSLCCFRSSNGG
jgi:molecular chaperone DnaK (HSP70)